MKLDELMKHWTDQIHALDKEEGELLDKLADASLKLCLLPTLRECTAEQLEERITLLGVIENAAYRRRMIASQMSTYPEDMRRYPKVQSNG